MVKKIFVKLNVVLIVVLLLFSISTANVGAYNFSVSGQAAILIEQESGRVLYEKDAHKQLRIASITKIMTAILAIESGKMDEIVTVSSNAFGTEGSSLYLRLGEKIKLEDLVYGLMLRSGNDSAVAIAEHVGGSLDGFVYLMNQKAKELGMHKSVFNNPHGLDDHEEHYSTAYDMALLTRYAMKDEKFKIISATKSYRAPQEGENWDRIWQNKNRLLTQLYKHSTGGKTGYTKRAKRTLVSTATKDNVNLIAVTLNAPSDWQDHMNMFNWGFETFEVLPVVEKGIVGNLEDDFYKNKVSANYSFEYPVTSEEKQLVNKKITLYNPPKGTEWQEKGAPNPVGKITIELKGTNIGEVPLSFVGELQEEKKSFWSKLIELVFLTLGVNKDG
ncbi:D-alanyl-D-alanine carboxypeptidase family protein [Anaerobacillus isosaccharinicus]|uniref:D-alanyl-D-alanine carboxypeptidase n=1 Tax=Anaerobacillus isosaccharinicus TaxID=1532552 RepID=A0A1S2M3K8_9BACI|nr:D-alanyl-D-alanine carboxypeptidase family protein [Anaerobacillus isosaccharinicus]MBA5585774.1 D-alanyl-D-alanine carboxypeptidase [Anaerobacillus isosaccharinicus]QOY35927.1 D-alanyl-D-alanine carboxypeptidase [Anaerobacillus isosaccharinicus]